MKMIVERIISRIGLVPRELFQFSSFVTEQVLFYGIIISNALDGLDSLLNNYSKYQVNELLKQQDVYVQSLPHSRVFCEHLLTALVGFTAAEIPPEFVDFSVIYWEDRVNRYRPVTPMALESSLRLIRSCLNSWLPSDKIMMDLVNSTVESDERSRPFERAIAMTILVNGNTTITTTQIDGSNKQHSVLSCTVAQPIFKKFPSEQVLVPTLLVQEDKDTPVSDLIIVTAHDVFVLQLTLGSPVHKMPNSVKENPYCAIYSETKYQQLVNSHKLIMPPGKTLAEALLSLTDRPSPVKLLHNQLVSASDNSPITNFHYIIICCKSFVPNPALGALAAEFPWVRVVYREHLTAFLPRVVVDSYNVGNWP